MMLVIHISFFSVMPWSVYFRLYNKRPWKSSEYVISSSLETMNDSSLNQTLSSVFQSSINGTRWSVEWSSMFQHKSESSAWKKPWRSSFSSFASLQCSCVIFEARGKWFPRAFLSTFSEEALTPLKEAKSTDGWLGL